MCIIDEVHQLSLFQVSAVAHYVKFVLLLFDKAQEIAFNQQNNSKGKDCLVDSKIWYPWARCIYGGSHMLPWMCMEEKNIVASTITRRFGKSITRLQRRTAMNIISSDDENNEYPQTGIFSPVEKPHLFTPAELALVPQTHLRFVKIYNEKWDGCDVRGKMLGHSEVVNYHRHPADDQDTKKTATRVAYGPTFFLNMIHEGLVFLSQLCAGYVFPNTQAITPLRFVPGQQVIVSMFYGNDLLFIFTSLLKHVVKNGAYRELYNIPNEVDVFSCWTTGTPDLVSGDTALLSQTAICPRIMDSADLCGNVRCDGRRVVGSTRGRYRITFYLAAECFSGEIPPAWKNFVKFLENITEKPNEEAVIQTVDVSMGEILAPISSYDDKQHTEQSVFDKLRTILSNPADSVSQISHEHYDLLSRFMHDGTSEVFSQMLSVTQDIVRAIRAEKGDGDKCITREDDEVIPMDICSELSVQKFSMLEYISVLAQHLKCVKLMPNLLGTAVYLFNDNHGQIVFHVLYPDATDEVVASINHLGRLFIYMVAEFFPDDVAPKSTERIEFRLVPHKLRQVGNQVIRDCYSVRHALTLMVLDSAKDDEHQLSYAYLGGGVTYEPPHCYGIVCKHMPVNFADRLMALLHCIGGVTQPQIIRRQNRNIQAMLNEETRELCCRARRVAINALIANLKQNYSSVEAMLQFLH